jgi:hypothetical protein
VRRWAAAGVVVAASLLVATAAAGDTLVGTLSLNPGVSLGVTCPNALTNVPLDANDLTVQCAANPTTTTTTVPPPRTTTTTVPPTTTTVPPPTSTTTTVPPTTTTTVPPAPGCGLANPAFCETFDAPGSNPPSNQRAGQLDGVLWGTSYSNGTSGNGSAYAPGACPGAGSVAYPSDIQVCHGQMATTVNDAGGVTSTAAYPRQPFDFAGRTGTITFDVSNDTQGIHAAWPELWVTDQPTPDPFVHSGTFYSVPRNGFGIRFAGCTNPVGVPSTCSPDGNSGAGVDSAVVVRNYVARDGFTVLGYQDVLLSRPGQMNHYQVEVSQTQIDVYGTNPFTGVWNPAADPLIHIATIPNVNLTFTRGLVWLEDVHYNGNKFDSQGTHTFFWDNLGFDGPVLPRDLGFDVADNAAADPCVSECLPGIDTAWTVPANGSLPLTVPDVGGTSNAAGALLVFNFYCQSVIPLAVSLNGNDLSEAWPFPDQTAWSSRTIAIPVPLTDIAAGNNTVTFYAGAYLEQVFNVDLILVGAGRTP